MAFAPAAVSSCRLSLFKAAALDFNGYKNWTSSACSLASPIADATRLVVLISAAPRKHIVCSAVQESSTPTVPAETKDEKVEAKAAAKAEAKTDTKAEVKVDAKAEAKVEAKAGEKAAPSKPKPAAKALAKALPELMEEDVIPSLRSNLEAEKDITELELVFKDNRLEGSFLQGGKPYTFWAFFSDGTLTGPKGFCISSYGSEVSTVEPFLVDEKKPTAKLVVFWVGKRLAAQGIIPVWKE